MERQKGFYVKHSYSSTFVNLLQELEKKYDKEIFNIQGIANDRLDIAKFSRDFFKKSSDKNVADVSVDGNANVKENNITQYNYEQNKALMKLNSLYIMHKYIKQIYSEQDAAIALEKVINGELFVNDLHTFATLPYSYFQETPIIVKINNSIHYMTMKKLFETYNEFAETLPDRENIDLTDVYKEINYGLNIPIEYSNGKLVGKKDFYRYERDTISKNIKEKQKIQVLDATGKWVDVSRVLRHKRHNKFISYQTNNGNFAIVTEDHPIILDDNSEIEAKDLKVGMSVKEANIKQYPEEYISVPEEMAYLIGFVCGDGNTSKTEVTGRFRTMTGDQLFIELESNTNNFIIYQNDWKNRKIADVFSTLYPDYEYKTHYKNRFSFSSQRLKMIMSNYFNLDWENASFTKTLPTNILSWTKQSKEAYICGLIDSEGSQKENGLVTIRMSSYSVITQLYDVLKSIGVDCHKRICNNEFKNLFAISFTVPQSMINRYEKSSKIDINTYQNRNSNMDTTNRNNKISKVETLEDEALPLTYGGDDIWEYVYDITTETGTFYANGMTQHNCYAFDLRPLLTDGMAFFKAMNIEAPQRSDSFIDLIIQSTAAISNQIAGACSYPDFFIVLNKFYEEDTLEEEGYIEQLKKDRVSYNEKKAQLNAKAWKKQKKLWKRGAERNLWYQISNEFQNIIFSLNFSFRGNQSAFTNLSVMDKGFIKSLFEGYVFPDMTTPNLDNAMELSKLFFEYYSEINGEKNVFTFPVMTLAISLDENGEYIDPDFVDWCAEANAEKAFANIFQSTPNSFSSCCRLRNEYEKVAESGYQNSFGVGGLSIGSHRVAGFNMPRMAILEKENPNIIMENLEVVHKILVAHRAIIQERIDGGFLPLYTSDWIHLKKQYSTVGFIGAYEYIKNAGLDIKSQEGIDKLSNLLTSIEKRISEWQVEEKAAGNIYNIEQIPGESMAVRLAEIDRLLNFNSEHDLYSNQYIPLIEDASIYDRFRIQGQIDGLTSGGAILHLNVDDEKPLQPNVFKQLIKTAKDTGTVYFAVNYCYSEFEEGPTVTGRHEFSPINGSPCVCQYTRVVGFVTPVNSWNKTRRSIEYPNRIFYNKERIAQ